MKSSIQRGMPCRGSTGLRPHIATGLVANAGHDLTISAMTEVNTKVLEFLGKTPAQVDFGFIAFIAQQIARLAVQIFADPGQRIEPAHP